MHAAAPAPACAGRAAPYRAVPCAPRPASAGARPGAPPVPFCNRPQDKKKKWEPPAPPPRAGKKQRKRDAASSLGTKLPTVTPSARCRLRLLKLERVKDYLLMEHEFVQNQERLKPQDERNEEDRSKVGFGLGRGAGGGWEGAGREGLFGGGGATHGVVLGRPGAGRGLGASRVCRPAAGRSAGP